MMLTITTSTNSGNTSKNTMVRRNSPLARGQWHGSATGLALKVEAQGQLVKIGETADCGPAHSPLRHTGEQILLASENTC